MYSSFLADIARQRNDEVHRTSVNPGRLMAHELRLARRSRRRKAARGDAVQ